MNAEQRADAIKAGMEQFLQDDIDQMNKENELINEYEKISEYERLIKTTIDFAYRYNIKLFREEEARQQRRLERRQERRKLREELRKQELLKDNRLAKFVNDPQNVHTTFLVQKIKEAVNIICAICTEQKVETLFEIISECNLDFPTVEELTFRYLLNEDIYELGPGIYKRVLDSVWQYIRISSNKTEMLKALRQELTDSVGLCAQGNLSRLCNVLAGYLEGLDLDLRSPVEILGSKFSTLLDIKDATLRIEKGKEILLEMAIPISQWSSWIDPLL